MSDTTTLWGGAGTDRRVFEYTVGEDREWDARLLRWDVLGSLGHIEGLRAARLITPAEHLLLRDGLPEILAAVTTRGLQLDQRHAVANRPAALTLPGRQE